MRPNDEAIGSVLFLLDQKFEIWINDYKVNKNTDKATKTLNPLVINNTSIMVSIGEIHSGLFYVLTSKGLSRLFDEQGKLLIIRLYPSSSIFMYNEIMDPGRYSYPKTGELIWFAPTYEMGVVEFTLRKEQITIPMPKSIKHLPGDTPIVISKVRGKNHFISIHEMIEQKIYIVSQLQI